ncbi:hypothetical protein HanXRQr2_Chr13g0617401 [Helianthus annuus]|uniref:Uncharacterized protein n=1 Tax=Helianthus annuus TaxID=4232 RepID=A0A9K3HCM3_HELAN|nr:hypothetical protein HanXRQr2_Chr13g0617401 [Helianthus annuus]
MLHERHPLFDNKEGDIKIIKRDNGLGHDHTLRVVVLDGGLEVGDMTPMWRVMTTTFSLSNHFD